MHLCNKITSMLYMYSNLLKVSCLGINIFWAQSDPQCTCPAGSFCLPTLICAPIKSFLQFLSDSVIEDLVRPLLAILDRPEKLLLLREIRWDTQGIILLYVFTCCMNYMSALYPLQNADTNDWVGSLWQHGHAFWAGSVRYSQESLM